MGLFGGEAALRILVLPGGLRQSQLCNLCQGFDGRAYGDEAKGTNANLRFSAGFCGFLQLPAKISGFLRKSAFPKKGENLQKSAKIRENLRLGSLGLSS